MTLTRIARVGMVTLFTLLVASIILVGNQRLAVAVEVPFPDVPSADVGDTNFQSPDVPSAQDIICPIFDYLNGVGSEVEVPFPVFTAGCSTKGAIEVEKIVSGGTASPSDFQIHVKKAGSDITGSPQSGSAAGRSYGNLSTGMYSISESGGPSGYTASFSGDCDAAGNVQVTAGIKKTCTITNTFTSGGGNSGNKPKLTVTKVVVNDGGGTAVVTDFSLSVSLDTEGSSESIGLASGVQVELSEPGTWVVAEEEHEDYEGAFSGDCDADGKVTLAPGEIKSCTLTNTYSPNDDGGEEDGDDEEEGGGGGDNNDYNPPFGGSPDSGGGGGGSAAATQTGTSTASTDAGKVLGAAASQITACDQYLTAFIRTGKKNDEEQVKRLQAVLVEFEKAEGVEITGVYDEATLAAVHAFQTKYASEILTPWGIGKSTGFVYLTTRKKVNEIYCQGTKLFPLTSEEQQIVDKTRASKSVSKSAQTGSKTEVKSTTSKATSTTQGSVQGGSASEQGGNLWDRVRGLFRQIRSPSIR